MTSLSHDPTKNSVKRLSSTGQSESNPASGSEDAAQEFPRGPARCFWEHLLLAHLIPKVRLFPGNSPGQMASSNLSEAQACVLERASGTDSASGATSHSTLHLSGQGQGDGGTESN